MLDSGFGWVRVRTRHLKTDHAIGRKHVYIYLILIHESHVFELRVETKCEVCDPRSFFTLLT